MKNSLRKILCCALALTMILGMACVASFADSGVVVNVDFSNADTTTTDYDNPGVFPAYIYDGVTPHSPIITITDGDKVLTEGTDYDLNYVLWNLVGAPETSSSAPVGRYIGGKVFNRYEVVIYGRGEYSDGFNYERAFYYIIEKPAYVIFFYKNDGSDEYDTSGQVYWGDVLSDYQIPEFEYPGHEFAGWYTDPECTEGNEFDVEAPIMNPPTSVYAKWTLTEPPVEPEPITSVTITLPEIKEGDGYTLEDAGFPTPRPEVTVPGDALYAVEYSFYVVKSDDDVLGYGVPKEAATFAKGDEVYIYSEIFPVDPEGHPFLDETLGFDHQIAVTVNGGELATSFLYSYNVDGDPDSNAGRSLLVVSKVVIGGEADEPGDEPGEEPSPSTGDMTMTWIVAASAMLLLAAVLVGADSKKKRTR